MAPETGIASRERRLLTVYMVVWALLGGTALTYLALLVTRPELVLNQRGTPAIADQDGNFNQRNLMRFTAEVGDLKAALGELRRDIGGMKRDAGLRAEQDKTVLERVTALEDRVTTITTAATVGPRAATRTSEFKLSPRLAAAAVPAGKPAAEAAPAPPPALPEPAKPALETSSIQPDAAARAADGGLPGFGVATVIPARAPIGIKLAAGPSVDALRLSWSLLLDRHKGVLAPLEPRYTVGSGGTHELTAGPFKSQAEANRVCAMLRARGAACISGRFDGDTL